MTILRITVKENIAKMPAVGVMDGTMHGINRVFLARCNISYWLTATT